MKRSFSNSDFHLNKTLKVIPTASQTFSKSYLQYPRGYSPVFLESGEGAYVKDIDGNVFIDLVNGLLSVVLGYRDPHVDQAIQNQLCKGISFSLSTILEEQLASKLVEIIPCAEMVRFGKTGTDATSAAIRLARAFTNREHILVSGYHGWQDWYIGTTTCDLGVPESTKQLAKVIPYNQLDILEHLLQSESYAAFIMEPTNVDPPYPGYLESVRDLTDKYGTLLIFDEMITGFRFSLGGAQSYFNVKPDLACFGKALGNGMPISAIVGRKNVMTFMDRIFFSGTFGGETLSLAAAIAVIQKIELEPVLPHIWDIGERLCAFIKDSIQKYKLGSIISICGYAPWTILKFKDFSEFSSYDIRTFFQMKMIEHGILISSSNNISYALKSHELSAIQEAYQATFESIAAHLDMGTLGIALDCPTIKPVFEIRKVS